MELAKSFMYSLISLFIKALKNVYWILTSSILKIHELPYHKGQMLHKHKKCKNTIFFRSEFSERVIWSSSFAIFDHMDEHREYYAKLSKSEKEKCSIISVICGIKKTNEPTKCKKH